MDRREQELWDRAVQDVRTEQAEARFVEEIYTEDGKTFEEEAVASRNMLGAVLLISAFFVALALYLAWRMLSPLFR